jgi:hypothetical protein
MRSNKSSIPGNIFAGFSRYIISYQGYIDSAGTDVARMISSSQSIRRHYYFLRASLYLERYGTVPVRYRVPVPGITHRIALAPRTSPRIKISQVSTKSIKVHTSQYFDSKRQ